MNKDEIIINAITTLYETNQKLIEIQEHKAALERELADILGHGPEGSKTYNCGIYKITCTTGWNWTLNKEEYCNIKSKIPACFNPVKERIAYDLDNKILKDIEAYASGEELELMMSVLTKREKKLHTKVVEVLV